MKHTAILHYNNGGGGRGDGTVSSGTRSGTDGKLAAVSYFVVGVGSYIDGSTWWHPSALPNTVAATQFVARFATKGGRSGGSDMGVGRDGRLLHYTSLDQCWNTVCSRTTNMHSIPLLQDQHLQWDTRCTHLVCGLGWCSFSAQYAATTNPQTLPSCHLFAFFHNLTVLYPDQKECSRVYNILDME
jgi:hypothetical protein